MNKIIILFIMLLLAGCATQRPDYDRPVYYTAPVYTSACCKPCYFGPGPGYHYRYSSGSRHGHYRGGHH